MASLDSFLFGALPYVALFFFVVGSAYRYLFQPFTFSSLSSQFLENEQHFWTLGPFHFGIIVVLLGHFLAFIVPGLFLSWNANTGRLFLLEVFGLIFGILFLTTLLSGLVRRITSSKISEVTSPVDWVLLVLLFSQAFLGVYIAVFHSWGSTWFAAIITPYLWSIFFFAPEVAPIAALPLMVKLHVIIAFLIFAFFPFTRLAHVLVAPVHYYWRKTQVVRWYREAY